MRTQKQKESDEKWKKNNPGYMKEYYGKNKQHIINITI